MMMKKVQAQACIHMHGSCFSDFFPFLKFPSSCLEFGANIYSMCIYILYLIYISTSLSQYAWLFLKPNIAVEFHNKYSNKMPGL